MFNNRRILSVLLLVLNLVLISQKGNCASSIRRRDELLCEFLRRDSDSKFVMETQLCANMTRQNEKTKIVTSSTGDVRISLMSRDNGIELVNNITGLSAMIFNNRNQFSNVDKVLCCQSEY